VFCATLRESFATELLGSVLYSGMLRECFEMDGSWIALNGSTQGAFHNKMLREHFARRCFGSVSQGDTQRAFCKERLEERFAWRS